MRAATGNVRPENELRVVDILSLISLALLLVVLRRPSMVLVPQFWAEDASVFFAGAERDGGGIL